MVASAGPLQQAALGFSLPHPGPAQDFPQAPGGPGESQRFASGLPAPQRAVVGVAQLGEGREALAMQPALGAPEGGSLRRGPLCQGGASAVQDELDVTGVLAPCVEGGHGALVGSQVALSVPPFLHQRVSASATWKHNSGTLSTAQTLAAFP